VARVNSDLIGKYVNIASRTAGFIAKRFAGKLTQPHVDAMPLISQLQQDRTCWVPIGQLYADREFGKAVREITRLLDEINLYIDAQKPWDLAKVATNDWKLHQVCSSALAMFWYVTILLKPILPETAAKAQSFLNLTDSQMKWGQYSYFDADHLIKPYNHLIQRVDPKQLDALFGIESEVVKAASSVPTKAPVSAPVVDPAQISIDDFMKVDLRVAKIVNAEHVDGSDKLLRLTLDVGEGKNRNVFSGIKSAYKPQDLVGRMTVMVGNLAPRKMKFGVSEGMVLAAGDGQGIFLLTSDSGAQPGMRVK